MEGRDEAEFDRFLAFDLSLGLPTTLADLKIPDVSDADLLKVGEQATSPADTMGRMPFKVTPDDVAQAIRGVDAYSRAYQERHHGCW